ncbi:hypothetical protein QLX08_002300 [Tetragonisca angustula]|uniref:RPGRIP1 C-terminal domain-containing protein n=1 Tax=Tetragonisca angustula TaxID=166442 RepID=A0AAW1AB84_9HYME
MADDPNRDILPVRESSCADSCRNSIDPRERYIVLKLDRYQLEDRYLRLLDEANNLKKLTNCQEDKIKRLTTKLMRVTTNLRPCTVALDVYEDKNRIIALELENSKLKDKISVLRNQLLSHTIAGRSSSRSRNAQTRPLSGRITCRSENSRTKIPCCHCIENGDNAQRNLDKIEELEAQKEEMSNRIIQLEKELSNHTVVNQREKVAENVEYIKVWRQMKQVNDKLIATVNENESLNVQINDLKRKLEEQTKSNETITTELLEERKRTGEVEEQMLKVKDSQLSLREKDEQIKDLANEMKILQQHNNELIDLSSKYGEVELENKELKKKVTEQLRDQETLKHAFNTEQSNIVTPQVSNEQLLGKIEELQKNIDSLTVQLTSLQTQTEKQEMTKITQISTKQADMKIPITADRHESHKDIQMDKCSKYCEALEKIFELDIARKEERCKICCKSATDIKDTTQISIKLTDKSVQTASTVGIRDQEIVTSVKEKSEVEESQIATESTEPVENYLTPDKMLKLLERAQISTSTDATRFNQKHMAIGVDYSGVTDQKQSHSGTETFVQEIHESSPFQLGAIQQQKKHIASQSMDPNTILSTLFGILQEYSTCAIPHEATTLYRSTPFMKHQFVKDINNNEMTLNQVATRPIRSGCSTRKYCTSPYDKQEKLKRKLCHKKHDGARSTMNKYGTTNSKTSFKNHVISSTSQPSKPARSYDTMNISCQLQDDKSREARETPQIENDPTSNASESLQEYIKHLDKCREVVSGIPVNEIVKQLQIVDLTGCHLMHKESKSETKKVESFCSADCPNNCADTSISPSDLFPLVIADGQGLMELHIVSLQISTSAKQILFQEKDINNVQLFVSWNIWNQETAYTPVLKYPKLNYNSSFVYRIPDLFSFFSNILLEFVTFQVNVFRNKSDNYAVAKGKLCIKDILDYPQNKLHYITPVNSIIPCSVGINFGQLSLWVRLSCDIEQVDAFKRKRGIISEPPQKTLKTKDIIPPKNDLIVLKESNDENSISLINEINTSVDDSSENSVDIDLTETTLDKTPLTVVKKTEEEPETSFLPSEQPEKGYVRTIKWDDSPDITEYKVYEREEEDLERESEMETPSMIAFKDFLSNNDQAKSIDSIDEVTNVISDKKWWEYKERNTGANDVSYDSKVSANNQLLEKDTIIIEIMNLILFPKSSVMQNPEYQLFYIEYCFLGYCGADMETISVRKPRPPNQKLIYNFKRKFQVNEEKYPLQNNILRAMLDGLTNPNIKFIIVCEPLPEETDIKECLEIGFANFNIRDYALEDNEQIMSLPVYNINKKEQIGLLKISVLGLDTIRILLRRRDSSI